jgi:beta-lactamase regulating signal transducer with metallopeptidase domain
MNEWQNLALAVLLVAMAEITNEIIIALFKVRNATTRFHIRLISLLSCFFVFLIVPLKVVELTILSDESEVLRGSSSVWGTRSAMMSFSYSTFALISLALVIIAVFCFLSMFVFSNRIVSRLLGCKPAADHRLLSVVEEVSREVGVTVKHVMISQKKHDAFVYGYPPSLAVGGDLLDILNDEELRIIIRHELYHVKGKDTLLKPMLTALCIIFLYNPMAWFLYRRLFIDRECCCDQKVLVSSHDTRTFLSLLLKVHDFTYQNPYSLAVHWMGSVNRIDSLFSHEKTRKIPVLVCLFFTLSSLFMGGTQLFEERYVEIEGSDLSIDSSALCPARVDNFSDYFSDLPLAEWHQKKIASQEVGIPLHESELVKLLSGPLTKGGVTIRMASRPIGRKPQFFGRNDIVSANCHLIIDIDPEGRLLVSLKQMQQEQQEISPIGEPNTPF